MERPQPYPFHAFLSHAGEDKPFVRDLKSGLEHDGWTVWLDELEILPGRSLRQQLDDGLRNSRFGIVVLSEAFFAKRWPQHELDALFALEGQGITRILPIWLNLTEASVTAYSAIISSRVAVISNGDAEQAARKLSSAIERILDQEGSWGDILRRDTRDNLVWTRPPQFFPDSLRFADQHFFEFWQGRSEHLPDCFQAATTPSLPVLFDATSEFAGKPVLIVGHQVAQQLLIRTPWREPLELHDYVIQIKSSQPAYSGYIVYVRIREVKRSGSGIDIPYCPPENLVSVAGITIARGAMTVQGGETYSCVYLAAARIYYLPRVGAPSRI